MAPKRKSCRCHSQTFRHAASCPNRLMTRDDCTESILHKLRPRNCCSGVTRSAYEPKDCSARSQNPAKSSFKPDKSNAHRRDILESKVRKLYDPAVSDLPDLGTADDCQKNQIASPQKTSIVRTLAKGLSWSLQESLKRAVKYISRIFKFGRRNHHRQCRELRRSWDKKPSHRTTNFCNCRCDADVGRGNSNTDVVEDARPAADSVNAAARRAKKMRSSVVGGRGQHENLTDTSRKSRNFTTGKSQPRNRGYQKRNAKFTLKKTKRTKRSSRWSRGCHEPRRAREERDTKMRSIHESQRFNADALKATPYERQMKKDKSHPSREEDGREDENSNDPEDHHESTASKSTLDEHQIDSYSSDQMEFAMAERDREKSSLRYRGKK